MVDRLDQVDVEARLPRLKPIFFLSPAGQRDQHQVLSPRLAADAAARLRSRSSAAGRCRAAPTSGRRRSAAFDRFDAVVRL